MSLSIFSTSIMKKQLILIICIFCGFAAAAQWEYVYETEEINAQLHGISFVNDSTGYVGLRGGVDVIGELNVTMLILKTLDYGNTWDTVFFELYDCPCPSGVIRRVTDVYFIDEQNGFFTTSDNNVDACQIVITNDGGETWIEHEIPLTSLHHIEMLNDSYGVCFSTNGGGVETFDGGQSWQLANVEFSWGLHIFNECNKMGVYFGLIRKEIDCVWSEESFPTISEEPSRSGRSVHAWDATNYIMGAAGLIGFDNFASIVRTEDGGETYSYLDFPFGGGTSEFTFVNDSTGYISTYSGSSFYQSTYQTTDRGITWQGVNTPFDDDGKYESLSDPSWVNEDVCYSINSNRTKILRTLTGVGELGQSWTMVPEHEREVKLSVYPNPATSFITIESEAPMQLLTLFNLLGERVAFQSFNGLTTTLEVNALPTGVYFLEVGFVRGSVVKKVVVD
jgi:photosystem II stability/assembly factor-like uncharacterized protein